MGKKKDMKTKVEVKNEDKDIKQEKTILATKIEKDFVDKEKTSRNKIKILKIVGIIIGLFALCGLVFFASTQREGKELVHYVKDITAQEYFDLQKGEEKSVILLASPGCGWCQKYRPILTQISSEYELPIYYLNTGELGDDYLTVRSSSPTLSKQYDTYGNPVISTPTTLLVQNGKEIDSIEGYVNADVVVDFLTTNGVIE